MSDIQLYPDGEQRRRIMDFIMAAGQTLLENGAEVFRVEQTMQIMARSLHLREFHVYVLTNGIFASRAPPRSARCATSPTDHPSGPGGGGERTVPRTGRGPGGPGRSRAAAGRGPAHPLPGAAAQILSGTVGSAAFALMFGGGLAEAAAAALAGCTVSVYLWACRRLPALFLKLTGAGLITLVCILACGGAGRQRQPRRHRRFDDPDPRRRLHHVHPGFCQRGLPLGHHPADRRGAGGRLPGLRGPAWCCGSTLC